MRKSKFTKSQIVAILADKPNQNAGVERFKRSFRDDVLNANLLVSV